MNFIKRILKNREIEKSLIALHEESKKEFCTCGHELQFDYDEPHLWWCSKCKSVYHDYEIDGRGRIYFYGT
jgi:hypothetical protein